MQRYNVFNMIHKALRNMMYDTALSLQQTWFADMDEAEPAIEKVEAVIYIFERHLQHVDNNVLPAIEKYDAALFKAFEAGDEKDLSLGNKLKNLINIYRNVNFEEERINSGSAICKTFIDFMIVNLEQMGREEIRINQILWKHYTDEQLITMNQQIVTRILPEESAITSKWMILSINNHEATTWLSGVKAERSMIA